jgi:hypothetical protein
MAGAIVFMYNCSAFAGIDPITLAGFLSRITHQDFRHVGGARIEIRRLS